MVWGKVGSSCRAVIRNSLMKALGYGSSGMPRMLSITISIC